MCQDRPSGETVRTGNQRFHIDDSAGAVPRGSVMDLLPFILAIVILVLVDLAAMRYGADSRGGFDSRQFKIR
jgi:hypothetical protein